MNVSLWFGGAVRTNGGARRWAVAAVLAIAATPLLTSPVRGAPRVEDAVAATDDLAGSAEVLKLGTYGLTSRQFEAFLNAVSTADTYGGDRHVAPVTWFSAARIAGAASDSRLTTPRRVSPGNAKSSAHMPLIPMESGWYRAVFHKVRGAKDACWVSASQADASAPGDLGGGGYDAGETYLRYDSATRESDPASSRSRMQVPDAFMLTASFPMASADIGNLR